MKSSLTLTSIVYLLLTISALSTLHAKDLLKQSNLDKRWIHEDIEKGYAIAKKTGKPLLVSFR